MRVFEYEWYGPDWRFAIPPSMRNTFLIAQFGTELVEASMESMRFGRRITFWAELHGDGVTVNDQR